MASESMDDIETKIAEAVLEVLKSADMATATEYTVRKSASEKLGIDLSDPVRMQLVRSVVETYLLEPKAIEIAVAEKAKEYDDCGDLVLCRLSDKRKVTLTEYKGTPLLSIREYYTKDGKELPSTKGISLTKEQWASFKQSVPEIEEAIKKMESRLN
ncbi:unnamed protein product [Cuscuta epithymum]|uniref:DEK-C domain-containing protein n=1 Tax=Cuscuta epithymum TaxID=186058 RepID=A0AAV0EQ47_9ASTE|nr:unnamed protein product [Cuscuta epithymum]